MEGINLVFKYIKNVLFEVCVCVCTHICVCVWLAVREKKKEEIVLKFKTVRKRKIYREEYFGLL